MPETLNSGYDHLDPKQIREKGRLINPASSFRNVRSSGYSGISQLDECLVIIYNNGLSDTAVFINSENDFQQWEGKYKVGAYLRRQFFAYPRELFGNPPLAD